MRAGSAISFILLSAFATSISLGMTGTCPDGGSKVLAAMKQREPQPWLDELDTPVTPTIVMKGTGWSAQSNQGAKIPIGWTEPGFDKFVQTVASDPSFEGADMVVLGGSRNHFEVGHRPQRDAEGKILADSDFQTFFPSSVSDETMLERYFGMTEALSPVNQMMGLGGSESFPMLGHDFKPMHTSQAFDPAEPFFSENSPQREKEIWAELVAKARSEGWSRNVMHHKVYNALGPFLKDDLVVVRKSPRSDALLKQLSERGYRNVVLIN